MSTRSTGPSGEISAGHWRRVDKVMTAWGACFFGSLAGVWMSAYMSVFHAAVGALSAAWTFFSGVLFARVMWLDKPVSDEASK